MSSLEELLSMFNLTIPFNENDLKEVRKKVLMLHPDKNINKSNSKIYYEKYKNAYQKLCVIYNYIKHETNEDNLKTSYDTDDTFKKYIEKHNIHKNPKLFSKHFNEMFLNVYVKTNSESSGYGEWLQSKDDYYNKDNIEESRKTGIQNNQIIRKNELETYNLDKNNYSDLKEAHKNTIVLLDIEKEFDNKEKFSSIEEYQHNRKLNNNDIKNKEESLKILQEQYKKNTHESLNIAYQYKKQYEEMSKKKNQYYSKYLMLNNL